MNGYLKSLLNLGIDSTKDYWESRRIRRVNTIVTIIALVSFTRALYGIFVGWPMSIILQEAIVSALSLVTLGLSYFRRTIAARILFITFSNVAFMSLTILSGPNMHFQYFAFCLLGVPFLFFKDEIGRLRMWLSLLPVFMFIFLEIYHFNNKATLFLQEPKVVGLKIFNDFVSFFMSFIIFYFLYRENNNYVKTLGAQSTMLLETQVQLEHFSYIAAHDLNEPLRTVTSFVDIVKEEYEDEHDENLQTYFSYIKNATTRMRAMVNGLLAYSKIGKSTKIESINTHKLIAEIKFGLSTVIKEKDAQIHFKVLPNINGVKEEIRLLFQNLISNAIKFQKPEAKPIIQISCIEQIDYWEFCVADNGIGIKPKNLENIFQFFTKLHLKTEYEGQGIGLAFCKKIVEAHYGKIWATSSEMEGSKFYFTIQKNITYKASMANSIET